MKAIVLMLIMVVLIVSFAVCGGKNNTPAETIIAQENATPEPRQNGK